MFRYKNDPAGFVDYRKQLIIKIIPILVISGSMGLVISYFAGDRSIENLTSSLITVAFVIAIFSFSIFRAIKQQRILYNDYLLTIADDYISCTKSPLLTVTIPFAAIKSITENKRGDLIVKGHSATQSIVISPGLLHYQEVKDQLNGISPVVSDHHQDLFRKYPLITPLVTAGLMGAVYISNNKSIVLIAGGILTVLMLWCFYKIRTATGVDAGLRRKSLWILLVIVSVIITIYFKVFQVS